MCLWGVNPFSVKANCLLELFSLSGWVFPNIHGKKYPKDFSRWEITSKSSHLGLWTFSGVETSCLFRLFSCADFLDMKGLKPTCASMNQRHFPFYSKFYRYFFCFYKSELELTIHYNIVWLYVTSFWWEEPFQIKSQMGIKTYFDGMVITLKSHSSEVGWFIFREETLKMNGSHAINYQRIS